MSERSEQAIAERTLARAAGPGVDVEVTVERNRLALTRFANSVIHQNVAEDTTSVRLSVHVDGRTAVGSATIAGDERLDALVAHTLEAARHAPRDPSWPGVAPAAPGPELAPPDPAGLVITPADRAERVRAFVEAAGGLEAAGYCRTNHWTGAFANSGGHTLAGERFEISMDGIARSDGADGTARATSEVVADIDGARLGARAAAKARAGADPEELPPGHYEVVLEPCAVADILEMLSVFGFPAKGVAERRSFVRLGDEQFDPAVTLVDDAVAAGYVFDAEGTPNRRVVLVDAGVTASLTHDRRTALAAGTESTGNSVGDPSWGGVARHLGLAPSGSGGPADEVDGPVVDADTAELVAAVERGVLVTDFWYTRVLDPRTLAVTGLTRNGVWLVENGEVTRPLRNFRFTQSYAQALLPGNVIGVGRLATALPGDTYGASTPRWTAPALRLAAWNFTGGASG